MPWFTPWERTLKRFLEGKEALDYGVPDPMIDFVIKDLAQTYVGQGPRDSKCFVTDDYDLTRSKVSFLNPSPAYIWHAPFDDEWSTELEVGRYMAVDYQSTGHFWVWIHQVDVNGNFRLMFFGRLEGHKDQDSDRTLHDWDGLDKLREFFAVEPHRSGVGCAHDAYNGDIYYHCARLGYYALRGEDRLQSFDEVEVDSAGQETTRKIEDTPHGGLKNTGPFTIDGQPVYGFRVHWNVSRLNWLADSIITGSNKRISMHCTPSNPRAATGFNLSLE